MDLSIIAQQLKSAIIQFLDHKDFSVQGNKAFKQKQKQLINFSKQLQCVPVCIQILSTQKNQKIQYFASMLLKDKLKYDYGQLDQTAIAQTHSMLVQLINNLDKPNKLILTNIVLCLVYIYIHSIGEVGTIVQFFHGTFSSGNQSSFHDILAGKNKFLYFFKFLELIPNQITDHKVVIDEESRDIAQKLIQGQQTQILKQMHEIFTKFSASQANKLSSTEQQILINAFSSWVEIKTDNLEIIYSLHHHILMKLTMSMLDDELMFETAGRCLRSIIEIMGMPEHNNQDLFMYISENLLQNLDKFGSLLKQCNLEIVEEYVKVLCEYGSICPTVLIAQYNQNIQKFLNYMLLFTETTELQVFMSLVDFWQCFISTLIDFPKQSLMTRQTANQLLGRLFTILFKRIKYSLSDLEHLNQISEKNLIDLHQKAQEISDDREQAGYIFYKMSNYLGKQAFVRQVLTTIRNLDPSNQSDFWTLTEAMIYSLRDVVNKYPGPSSQICQIVLLYQQLKPSYIMVKRSFCRVFYELFTMETKNDEFITKILGHIINMLPIPLLSDRAEKAFNKCCRQNEKIVGRHIENIYQLINVYPQKIGLLSGIAHVIKQSPEMIAAVVPNLAKIQISKLDKILTANDLNIKKSKKELLNIFESIFSLLNCIPSKQISESDIQFLQQLFTAVWPYLQKLITNPIKRQSDEDNLVQQSIKLIKIIMRLIPDQFLKYMETVSTVVINAFKKYPISSFIYYYELVLTQYRNNKNQKIQKYLQDFFVEVCNLTIKHVEGYGGIVALPILVDDFMGLAKRIVKYNKLILLLQSQKLEMIFKFAVLGLQSSQPRVASSCSQFFEIVFMIFWMPHSRKKYADEDIGEVVQYDQNSIGLYQQLKEYLLPTVSGLIVDLFQCLEKVPVQSARANVLDCLLAIALAFPNQSQELWISPLNTLQIDILTEKQKQKLKINLKGLGSNNPTQFYNSEIQLNKLLFNISVRYMHRDSRQNLSNMK